jgi:hypothetical protein
MNPLPTSLATSTSSYFTTTIDICPGCMLKSGDAEIRSTRRSALPSDLGSEGLRYYLLVPHNKCVGSEFVRIVRCFGRPNNIAVIALNRSVLHRERGSRLCKFGEEGLKERLDRGWAF